MFLYYKEIPHHPASKALSVSSKKDESSPLHNLLIIKTIIYLGKSSVLKDF